jgi:hypothetical protein
MTLLRTIILFLLILGVPAVVYAQELTDEMAQDEAEEEEELEAEEVPPEPIDYSVYEELYGKNLKSVPFSLKYAFSKEKEIAWEEADVLERARFIHEWENARAIEELEEFTREYEIQQIAYQREIDILNRKQIQDQKEYQRELDKITAKMESDQKKAEVSNKVQTQKIKMLNLRQGRQ